MKPKLTPEMITGYRQETIAPAKEVLEYVYQAVLRTPEFTLSDGSKGQVEAYYPPAIDDAGELTCGFDVALDNGTHLEFTVNNTGWGKSFVAAHAARKGPPGRQR